MADKGNYTDLAERPQDAAEPKPDPAKRQKKKPKLSEGENNAAKTPKPRPLSEIEPERAEAWQEQQALLAEKERIDDEVLEVAREERERLGEMPINVGDLDPEAVPKLVEILKRRDALPFLIYGRRVRWAKLRSEELEVLLEELGRKCKEYYAAYQEKEEEFRRIEAERNEAMGIHYDYVQQRGDCEKDFNRTRNQLAYLEETGPDADAITRLRR